AQRIRVLHSVLQRLLRLGRGEAVPVNLQMAEPVADGALAQRVERARFVAAEQDQADRAEDDDDQRDRGAAAIAEDVAKGECGEHGFSYAAAASRSSAPSCMRMQRGARAMSAGSCVAKTNVVRVSALSRCRRSRIFAAVSESRFAVGSSARTS